MYIKCIIPPPPPCTRVQDIDGWLHELETSGTAKRKALESLVLNSAKSIQQRRDTLFSIETSITEEKAAIVCILKKQGELCDRREIVAKKHKIWAKKLYIYKIRDFLAKTTHYTYLLHTCSGAPHHGDPGPPPMERYQRPASHLQPVQQSQHKVDGVWEPAGTPPRRAGGVGD